MEADGDGFDESMNAVASRDGAASLFISHKLSTVRKTREYAQTRDLAKTSLRWLPIEMVHSSHPLRGRRHEERRKRFEQMGDINFQKMSIFVQGEPNIIDHGPFPRDFPALWNSSEFHYVRCIILLGEYFLHSRINCRHADYLVCSFLVHSFIDILHPALLIF